MKRRPIDGKFFDSKAKGSSVSNKERWIDYLLGPSGALLVNAILGGSFLNIFYTDVIGIGNLWKGMFLAVFPIVSKILDATAETLPAMLQQIRDLGYTMQISADTLKPTLDGVYTIAVNQNAAINNAFIFLYLGLDVVVSAVCIALLAFANVEKTISFKLHLKFGI